MIHNKGGCSGRWKVLCRCSKVACCIEVLHGCYREKTCCWRQKVLHCWWRWQKVPCLCGETTARGRRPTAGGRRSCTTGGGGRRSRTAVTRRLTAAARSCTAARGRGPAAGGRRSCTAGGGRRSCTAAPSLCIQLSAVGPFYLLELSESARTVKACSRY